ncbi:MAG: AAA family ATPase [Patescibacteria group bacterium]
MNGSCESSVLYLTGPHAAGKTELCGHLTSEYNFGVVETGGLMRGLYADRGPQYRELSMGEYVRAVEKDDSDFFGNMLVDRVKRVVLEGASPVIINGMRTYSYINSTTERLGTKSAKVLWIEANRDLLLERYNRREGRSLCPEEFEALLAFDMNLGISEIREKADAIVVNEGRVDSFKEETDKILFEWGFIGMV